jgi:hypothetical protein
LKSGFEHSWPDFLILQTVMSFKYFHAVLFCYFLSACSGTDADEKSILHPVSATELPDRWKAVMALSDSVAEGDLVLRCGNDYTSETLRDFSQQEKLYSHSGIALRHNGRLYVYSNMAGDINPNEVMRRDPVDSFLSPVSNIVMGVYRYSFSTEELSRLKKIVESHYENKLRFDMNFDLSTDDKMYCVEMIAKSVEEATAGRIRFTKSMVNDDLRKKYLKMAIQKNVLPTADAANQREYLAIDNLYMNPECREIKKLVFGSPKKPVYFPSPENDSN